MDWLTGIKNAEKTSIVEDGKRKVHYKFPDGQEMAEEYNLATNILVRRAWKYSGNLTKKSEWIIEVGDPEPKTLIMDSVGIQETSNSPYVIKRLTKTALEWRIRNLPYPVDTYSVTASPEDRCIIVRTSNKKYFKKINIPELERCELESEQKNIDFSHKFNTLIITYKKPAKVLQMEAEVLKEIANVKSIDKNDLPSCNPS